MDRLTGYTGCRYEAYDPIDTKYDYSETNLQKLIDKLAHYEGLEESGRLVVLPEGSDEKKLFRVLSYSGCPNMFDLPRSEKCPVIPCKDCWENALKIKE